MEDNDQLKHNKSYKTECVRVLLLHSSSSSVKDPNNNNCKVSGNIYKDNVIYSIILTYININYINIYFLKIYYRRNRKRTIYSYIHNNKL